MPTNVGTSITDLAAVAQLIGVLLLMPFGPTIGGFIVSGRSDGRDGVKALWKRFWSRRFTIIWLIVILGFYPLYFLVLRSSGAFILGREQPTLWWLGEP
jgi:hypothetical protein